MTATATATVTHTPGPWRLHVSEMNPHIVEIETVARGAGYRHMTNAMPVSGARHLHACDEHGRSAEAMANARLMAAAPEMLAALRGLIEQVTGPAMIYGDGRGRDGIKDGLSHQEFNALRKARIDAALAVLATVEGR